MNFSLEKSLEILENTPHVVSTLLRNLSDDWTIKNEGENTWSAKEVVAHLIVCEETDWLTRARIILSDKQDKTFVPIDMTAHFEIAQNNSLKDLLFQFKQLREIGTDELKAFNLQEHDFLKTANHPVLGAVNLQQLIATWVTHDLTHIAQIARVIAKQNNDLVASFKTYLSILNK